MTPPRSRTQGRPSATDHAAIERAAFRLFDQQGFDSTTMEQIADAVGVGRRTIFRYFPSKNDIPWGQFDESLQYFRAQFEAVDPATPMADAVHACVVSFNAFDDEVLEQHRTRMELILMTPALQAHSSIKYAAWRQVIADYVARRTSGRASDPLPSLVGHVSLALAVASYEQWLAHPHLRLTSVLDSAMTDLRRFVLDSDR